MARWARWVVFILFKSVAHGALRIVVIFVVKLHDVFNQRTILACVALRVELVGLEESRLGQVPLLVFQVRLAFQKVELVVVSTVPQCRIDQLEGLLNAARVDELGNGRRGWLDVHFCQFVRVGPGCLCEVGSEQGRRYSKQYRKRSFLQVFLFM